MFFTDAQTNSSQGDSPANGNPKRRVLLVDDHAIVRAGLAMLINQASDLVTCGEAEDERSALEAVGQLHPDVAVVDWSLRNGDSSELIESLRRDYPETPVLVLSMHDEMLYAERALRAGASGYVMKREVTDKIVEAILSVAAGIPYLSERVAHAVGISCESRGKNKLNSASTPEPFQGAAPHFADGEKALTPLARTKASVSIVIPVYNAEKTIKPLVDQLIRELGFAYRLQIVLVEDGSSDQSASVCKRLHESNAELVDFVMLSRNFGEHNAVMAGLHYAEGDYCVVMDDDLQNPPSEVRNLIEEITKRYDVVYARYRGKQHSSFRNLCSRLHNWMATHALGKPADLYLSSFKVMSRFVVREVVRYPGPDPYIDAIILRTTRNIGAVTVKHETRGYGRSGYTLSKLLSLWGNMIVAFSLYPVRLMGLVGVVMATVGCAYGLYDFMAWMLPFIPDPDSNEILKATQWFFRGVTILSIGILGEYVGRIYRHLNRAPQFIVRDIGVRHPKNASYKPAPPKNGALQETEP